MHIFVGNISTRIKETHLRELFEAFGEVNNVKILKDLKTGQSKGIAFIDMKYDGDAKAAIEKLNKCELDGTIMRVTIARPHEQKNKNNQRKPKL